MPIKSPTKVSALTLKANGIARSVISDLGVSEPFIPNNGNKKQPKIHSTKALWDTGATQCVITGATAKTMGLVPIGMTTVETAGGPSNQNEYLVNFYLPGDVVIHNVRVTECKVTSGNFGAIIGMNVITAGDFSITNVNGNTTASFRVPSLKEIDYVKELNQQKTAIARPKVGRNEPCPCGSGKKYKNCCGK